MIAPAPTLILANLPDNPAFADVIQFQLTGLVVVFGALALIWLLLEILGAFFRRLQKASPPKAAAVPLPSAVSQAELSSSVVAAIAAAVHVTMDGKPHRVSAIKASVGNPHWAAEGRREHFSSHRVR